MRCPVCQLEICVERQAGEVVLTYCFKDWAERCRYQRGDPILCANLMPAILELLPQTKPLLSDHSPVDQSAKRPR